MAEDDKLTEEIFAMFANTKMEATQSYIGRGRLLQSHSSENLKVQWIAQLIAMADAQPEFNRQLMDDLESELSLRGIESPADQVPEVVERLAARSRMHTDNWTSEQLEEAERGVQRELAKVQPSKADKN